MTLANQPANIPAITRTVKNPLRIISLGWGVQSFTLAAMTALEELPPVDFAVHADTTHEAEGTYAHAAKWTPWLEERGVKVVTVQGTRTDVVQKVNVTKVIIPAFTSADDGKQGQVRRQCTGDWKINPIRRFIRSQIGKPTPGSVQSLQGISLDEWQRMRTSDVKYIENVYPLVDARISRAGCIAWLNSHGLDVPPKSACTFCPYHSLGMWRAMKQRGGPDWSKAVIIDSNIRNKRMKGAGLLLYVHPARLPLEEAVNIPEDHGAKQLELDMPCDSGACWV